MTFYVGTYGENNTQNSHAVARVAAALGATGFFTIGSWGIDRTDIETSHFRTLAAAVEGLPEALPWIALETGGQDLGSFEHPGAGIYLLGPQMGSLTNYDVLDWMAFRVTVEGPGESATVLPTDVIAGIVLHHRIMQGAELLR